MIVNIINEQFALDIAIEQVERLVKKVIESEEQTCDEVNVYFVDTPTISQLHEQFFNDSSSTDCISFPMDEEEGEQYRLLGEVFICPATAIDYAAKNQGNAYQETSLYIVHSLLHLMGYDDIEEEDICLMRRAEERHMQKLQSLGLQLQPIKKEEIKSLRKSKPSKS